MSETDIEGYVSRYGGRCRDCADAIKRGVCDHSGGPCDPNVERAVIRKTIEAIDYGLKHGFIENPFEVLRSSLSTAREEGRKAGLEEAAKVADACERAWTGSERSAAAVIFSEIESLKEKS